MADGEGVPVTVDALRMRVGQALAAAGIEDPAVDAELLVGHVLGLSRGQVQSRAITRAAVDAGDAARVLELTARRARREPLQHITGVAHFRSLELLVGPGVFVPRPET